MRYFKKQKIDSSHENAYSNGIREYERVSFLLLLLSRDSHNNSISLKPSTNLVMHRTKKQASTRGNINGDGGKSLESSNALPLDHVPTRDAGITSRPVMERPLESGCHSDVESNIVVKKEPLWPGSSARVKTEPDMKTEVSGQKLFEPSELALEFPSHIKTSDSDSEGYDVYEGMSDDTSESESESLSEFEYESDDETDDDQPGTFRTQRTRQPRQPRQVSNGKTGEYQSDKPLQESFTISRRRPRQSDSESEYDQIVHPRPSKLPRIRGSQAPPQDGSDHVQFVKTPLKVPHTSRNMTSHRPSLECYEEKSEDGTTPAGVLANHKNSSPVLSNTDTHQEVGTHASSLYPVHRYHDVPEDEAGKSQEETIDPNTIINVTGSGLFECSKCLKTYKSRRAVRAHVLSSCDTIRRFICPHDDCYNVNQEPSTFRTSDDLREHLWRMHVPAKGSNPRLGKRYQCSNCNKSFHQKWKVDDHVTSKCGTTGPFSCPYENCERAGAKGFTCRDYLNKHIRRHHQSRKK